MTADLVCDALQMALWKRKMPTGVIVHSDRGGQYVDAVSVATDATLTQVQYERERQLL